MSEQENFKYCLSWDLYLKLGMRSIAAKFVPRLLTDMEKWNRVNVSEELFSRANKNETFLKTLLEMIHGFTAMTLKQKITVGSFFHKARQLTRNIILKWWSVFVRLSEKKCLEESQWMIRGDNASMLISLLISKFFGETQNHVRSTS